MTTRARLEFVGTATTVLRLGPFTLLTDPNFLHRGQRAYLGKGLWSRRRTEPSMQPADLPPLDLVLLSHLHGDHFDRVARRGLDKDLPIATTREAAGRLETWGFGGADGLLPWETRTWEREGHRLRLTAAPGRHAPGLLQSALPPVMGSVLDLTGPDGTTHRTYITGDTLFRPWLADVVDRCGPLDAVVAHLGGTRILGVLVTMDAAQGADLVELLRPRLTVPVHHDDYGVFRSPLSDFVAEWRRRGLPGELRTVARGQDVSLVPGPDLPGERPDTD